MLLIWTWNKPRLTIGISKHQNIRTNKQTNKNERDKVRPLPQTLELIWVFDLTIPLSQSNPDKTRKLVNSKLEVQDQNKFQPS